MAPKTLATDKRTPERDMDSRAAEIPVFSAGDVRSSMRRSGGTEAVPPHAYQTPRV